MLLPFDNDDALFVDSSECVGFDDVAANVLVEVATDIFVEVASDVLEWAGERFPFEDAAAEWDPPFRMLKFEKKIGKQERYIKNNVLKSKPEELIVWNKLLKILFFYILLSSHST